MSFRLHSSFFSLPLPFPNTTAPARRRMLQRTGDPDELTELGTAARYFTCSTWNHSRAERAGNTVALMRPSATRKYSVIISADKDAT